MRDPIKAKVPAVRHPTDTNKLHNTVLSAGRMQEMGGASALNRPGSPHRNKLPIRKPGGGAKGSY